MHTILYCKVSSNTSYGVVVKPEKAVGIMMELVKADFPFPLNIQVANSDCKVEGHDSALKAALHLLSMIGLKC